jgi:hypothetical protein
MVPSGRFREEVAPLATSRPALVDTHAIAVWSEWGRITQFLESVRVALAREHDLWTSLNIETADDVTFTATTGRDRYRVCISDHLAAIADHDTLYASVLIHSYAIAESAAAHRLDVDPRGFAGIEDWGGRLLATTGETWDAVRGGLAGAVEVAVVRNAYAHGARCIDETAAKRLLAAGVTHRAEGDLVALNHTKLKAFRGRLKYLLRAGGIGHGG